METNTITASLVLLALAAVYLIPAWVAFAREHHQRGAITALNFALGWTLLGWVGALVWALTQVKS